MVLPQGSTTQSQTISFPQLPNVQYGNTFSLSASSSCQPDSQLYRIRAMHHGGKMSGVGFVHDYSSAPGNNTYSAASRRSPSTFTPRF